MKAFQERDILRLADDTARWRVVLKSGEDAMLFDMDGRLALPEWRNAQEVQAEIDAEHLINDGPGEAPALSASERHRAEERYSKFEPILNDEEHRDNILFPEGRTTALHALKLFYSSLTFKVLIQALRAWWRGGMTNVSLTDNYANCGRKSIDREKLEEVPLAEAKRHLVKQCLSIERSVQKARTSLPDHTKDGRPRQRRAPVRQTTIKVDRRILRVFVEYYKWKHAEMGRSIRDAYKRMCAEELVTANRDGSIRKIAARAHPRYYLFENWYYELIDYKSRRVSIRGEKGYGKNDRERTGNERSRVRRAGIRASGDATIWNISIVSRMHGRRVVGPPLVFRIRCTRTGMLLGIAITMADASWTLAAAAIANCLEDKVEFCARYGLKIKEKDWPCRGFPAEFVFDRGETDNTGPDKLTAKTGVRVKNLPGDRPDLKGGSESDFRTLQIRLNGKTPAACVQTWEQQTRAGWKFEAELDIEQFTRLILKHELDRMKQRRPDMKLPPKMIGKGLTSSPLDFWRYSVEHEGASLTSWDMSEVQLLLMRRATASITESGVLFKGCAYLNDELSASHEFAKARRLGRKTVEVAYDDRLVDQVYITHIERDELEHPLICRLSDKLDHQLDYFGKCFMEVKELANKQALNDEAARQYQEDSTQATQAGHKAILEEAREEMAAAPDHGTRAQQKRDLPAARRAERFADEPQKAFRPEINRRQSTETEQSNAMGSPAKATDVNVVSSVPAAAPSKTLNRFLDHIKNLSKAGA